MYTITRIQTRPNIDSPFFIGPNSLFLYSDFDLTAVGKYLKENYIDTNKLLIDQNSMQISEDQLTLTLTRSWDTEESYNEYMNDAFLQTNLFPFINKFFSDNNITNDIG